MKSKLLLVLCVFCATISNYAQSSATQSGIAIQGIARDVNNTALTNQTVNLTFTIYYLDASSIEQTIYEITKNETTDAFGVFSDVIDPTAVNSSVLANNVAYLRIKKGTTDIISDEKLRHVPYAISANNGVPTGSIMPFIGTVAPEGWALCNGAALPVTAKALIALVGNNAPNLQGMFLRGTGTNTVNNEAGPALKATQGESLKSHSHGKGTLTTETAGNHNHTNGNYKGLLSITKQNTVNSVDPDPNQQPDLASVGEMQDAGNHTHNISGSTADFGGTETRPVNYGVNYIIKL